MTAVLSPFVYWAQTEKLLHLKVDLKEVKEPEVLIETRRVHFKSKGLGAKGLHEYEFSIDFKEDVQTNNKESCYKVTDSKVDFTLTKATSGWWSRLTSQPQKPAWLKIDFDRWQSEEDLNDEDVRDVREDYPGLYEELQKAEIGYKKEDFKKVYLTFYNLFMYVGFMYVLIVLSMKYLKEGRDCFGHIYKDVGSVLCCIQLLQLLEVMHPIFGYVKGSPFMPFVQIIGRIVVLIFMIESEPRMQTKPVIFYLFVVWSSIEIIRYPYYLCQIYKKENGFLTWLRYSAWIVLYPLGFVCEGVVLFRSLLYIEETNRWSVSLPNALNFTFHCPTVIRIYMLFLMLPAMYMLMVHMYKVRKQKLGLKKRFKKH